ncbi:MAG: hypothetical protein AB7I19_00740 [Planctomycetota bacterium]
MRRILRSWSLGSAVLALLAGCAIEPQDPRSGVRSRNPMAWSTTPLPSAASVAAWDGTAVRLLELLEGATLAGEDFVAGLAWERLRRRLVTEPRLAAHWEDRLARSAPRDLPEPVSIPAAPKR